MRRQRLFKRHKHVFIDTIIRYLGIIILVDQTLMLVVDHFGDGWESLIKGEGEYNTLVGRAGGLQEGVTSV